MKIYEKFNLQKYNSYRLNAFCTKVYFPESENDLVELYNNQSNIPKIIIGNGNNIVLSRDSYKESFIVFNGYFNRIEVNGTEMSAEAGATMLRLSETALLHSLSGLEIFYDIPSSVGGAVVMNAGAGNEEIKNLILKVRYFDTIDLKIKELRKDELDFEYRNSFFQKHAGNIVLKAWLKLNPGIPEAIKTKMDETKQIRWAKQPREYPNCGSVFKRPPGRFVGPMLDELGLKGFSIGGAKISQKHSGFIVNMGNATGKDIIELIEYARTRVKERFGLDLEIEQRII